MARAMVKAGKGLHFLGVVFGLALVLLFSTFFASSAYAASPITNGYTQTELGYQVIPVNLQAGAVRLDFEAGASSASAGIYAKADKSGSTSGTITFVSASVPYASDSRYGNVAKTGTYYVVLYASRYSGSTGSTAVVTQFPYSAVESVGLNGSAFGTGCGDYSKVSYFKITSSKRGCLTVNVLDATLKGNSSYVQLCDSKKRSLSGADFTSVAEGRPAFFGVKKGTYYLAVKSYAPLYDVSPSFKAYPKAVKSKKGKAALIKKGKAMTAVMAAGEKTAWYKFKITKKKACRITVAAQVSDTLKMTFTGKNYYSGIANLYKGASSKVLKTNKLRKGTYYVQVSSINACNGLYSIKWK